MKRILLAALLLSATALAQASLSKTSEVLVLASAATKLTQTSGPRGRLAIEIYNNGPNTIWCAFSEATAVVNKSRPIASGTAWALDAPSAAAIWCRASTADQVTGAATIVSELLKS